MSNQKYADVLQLMDAVIAANSSFELAVAWDKLYTSILDNFTPPGIAPSDEVLAECMAMMRNVDGQFSTNLRSDPPVFSEAVFPAAVMRYLVRAGGVMMNPRYIVTFTEFYKRYGKMVFLAGGLT